MYAASAPVSIAARDPMRDFPGRRDGPYFPYRRPNVEAAVSDHDNNKIDTIAIS